MASVAPWSDSLIRSLLSRQPGEIARLLEKVFTNGVREVKEWLLNRAIDRVMADTFAAPEEASPWACRRCGPRCGRQLRRNGSYKRSPITLDGPVQLRIPQLLCRDCNQAVPFELPCLGRYSRLWLDLSHQVVKQYMLGHSYRAVAANTAQGIGLMTAWRCLQRAAEGDHALPPSPELVAIGLDEVHNRVHGEPMWLLTARGLRKDGVATTWALS